MQLRGTLALEDPPPSNVGLSTFSRSCAWLSVASALMAAACGGAPPASPTQPTAIVTTDTPSGDAGEPGSSTPPPTPPPPAGTSVSRLVAVGDVGWCGSPGVAQTAALVDKSEGDLLLLGDLAYPNGTTADFQRCYDPDYGRFKGRSRPGPGNHEYDVANGDAYYTYFGAAAGPNRLGYYAYRSGSWQVLVLNSSVPIGRGSAQYQWVREQLDQRARCTLATVHHPYDSSGPHGQTPILRDVWQLLYDGGAEVVLNGHDHNYERLAPQAADLSRDLARGLRQFTVGTGGAPLYAAARRAVNSEVFLQSWGVLRLTLEPTQYQWEFVDVNGAVLDRGADVCH